MDFETFLKMYKEWQSKPRMYVVNNIQMKHMKTAYEKLENILHKYTPDAKIEVGVNEFNDGSASITAETDEMIVKDVGEFIAVIEHASNFEIYPLTDGNIRISITFNDMMTLIK